MDVAPGTRSRIDEGAASAPDRSSRPRRRRPAAAGRHSEARTQEAAKAWIREHQEIALVAAFAFGAFVGAWMRS